MIYEKEKEIPEFMVPYFKASADPFGLARAIDKLLANRDAEWVEKAKRLIEGYEDKWPTDTSEAATDSRRSVSAKVDALEKLIDKMGL